MPIEAHFTQSLYQVEVHFGDVDVPAATKADEVHCIGLTMRERFIKRTVLVDEIFDMKQEY